MVFSDVPLSHRVLTTCELSDSEPRADPPAGLVWLVWRHQWALFMQMLIISEGKREFLFFMTLSKLKKIFLMNFPAMDPFKRRSSGL